MPRDATCRDRNLQPGLPAPRQLCRAARRHRPGAGLSPAEGRRSLRLRRRPHPRQPDLRRSRRATGKSSPPPGWIPRRSSMPGARSACRKGISTRPTAAASIPGTPQPSMSLFVSQHFKPHVIWSPAYQRHPNTAMRVTKLTYVAQDPEAFTGYLSAMFGFPPTRQEDGVGELPHQARRDRSSCCPRRSSRPSSAASSSPARSSPPMASASRSPSPISRPAAAFSRATAFPASPPAAGWSSIRMPPPARSSNSCRHRAGHRCEVPQQLPKPSFGPLIDFLLCAACRTR